MVNILVCCELILAFSSNTSALFTCPSEMRKTFCMEFCGLRRQNVCIGLTTSVLPMDAVRPLNKYYKIQLEDVDCQTTQKYPVESLEYKEWFGFRYLFIYIHVCVCVGGYQRLKEQKSLIRSILGQLKGQNSKLYQYFKFIFLS